MSSNWKICTRLYTDLEQLSLLMLHSVYQNNLYQLKKGCVRLQNAQYYSRMIFIFYGISPGEYIIHICRLCTQRLSLAWQYMYMYGWVCI